jgi:hypothetical protein
VRPGLILDPCSGTGNLLEPWKKIPHSYTLGIDIDKDLREPDVYTDFLSLERRVYESYLLSRFACEPPISLVLCNPPFNGYGNKLGSEMRSIENTSIALGQVWLDKIIELFGKEVPIVLFTPVGFRLNLTLESPRHKKLAEGIYPPISSQITLPKNIFEGVIFHSEILIFNIPNLKNHYFYKPHQKEISK